jgi:hypothetical protein
VEPVRELPARGKLRRARHRTIPSHRSPLKPSIERLANFRTPKRPSEGRQPDFKLRVEYINELQNHLQAPKNLSATHRPESELQKTHPHSSSLRQGPEEPVNKPSEDSELPKNTSTNARFASGIRRNLQQSVVSLPSTQKSTSANVWRLQGSEEPIRNP